MKKLYLFVIVGLLCIMGVVKGEKKELEKKKSTTIKLPAQLKRDGILVTNKAYKQIFKAYIQNPCPFITSDSLLNAYHVLYEKSVCNLERKQALILKDIVCNLYKKLDEKEIHDAFMFSSAKFLKAIQRDKLVIGIAGKLFNPDFKLKNSELNKLADIEVNKINRAKGISMPKWLGEESNAFLGFDYSRFKPRSFYNKSELLKRYFRATAWLQAVPFKVKKDNDLLAFMILRQCWYKLKNDYRYRQKYRDFFTPYYHLLGKEDGVGINSGFKYIRFNDKDNLKNYRKKLLNSKNPSQINDSLRISLLPKIGITDLRILPARKTPGAILFSFTTNPYLTKCNVPSGLEISALLGSDFAMKQLLPKVREIIKKKKNLIQKYTLYDNYMNTLKTLFDNKDIKLPAFMKNKSWEIKSCNTVLGSWAQMRHTWSLQAKHNAQYMCIIRGDTGFVEPNIAFWGRMAQLCERTRKLLNKYKCLKDDPGENIELYKKLSTLIGKEARGEIRFKYPNLRQIIPTAHRAICAINGNKYISNRVERDKKDVEALKKLIVILENNSLNKYPELEKRLNQKKYDLNELWIKLQIISLKLQAISLKQLSDIPRSDDEKRFIGNYGKILGKIMLYSGNSYMAPRDDAPRIVDVFTDADETGVRYLEVGIGRAREILVLYPTSKGNVLCRGAILPYYEFFSKKRLTDTQWKKILDSNAKRPNVPDWLVPIIQAGKLKVPARKGKY